MRVRQALYQFETPAPPALNGTRMKSQFLGESDSQFSVGVLGFKTLLGIFVK
jgi:hypothetical protein